MPPAGAIASLPPNTKPPRAMADKDRSADPAPAAGFLQVLQSIGSSRPRAASEAPRTAPDRPVTEGSGDRSVRLSEASPAGNAPEDPGEARDLPDGRKQHPEEAIAIAGSWTQGVTAAAVGSLAKMPPLTQDAGSTRQNDARSDTPPSAMATVLTLSGHDVRAFRILARDAVSPFGIATASLEDAALRPSGSDEITGAELPAVPRPPSLVAAQEPKSDVEGVPTLLQKPGPVQQASDAAPAGPLDVAAAFRAAHTTEPSRSEQRDAAAWRPTTGSPGDQNEMLSVLLHRARGDEHDVPQGERHSSPNATDPVGVQAIIASDHSGKPSAPVAASNTWGSAVPAADRAELVSRVAATIEAMHAAGGRHEAVLHLSPPHLGEMRVAVASDRFGLSAQITASTEGARAVLEAARDQLKAALEQKGFSVAGLGVALSQNNGKGAQEAPRRSFPAVARASAVEAPDLGALDRAVRIADLSVRRNGRLDARV
ncbi:MAG: flagellar hook-length control protein FliK [Chthonomonadales bacterium]